MVCKPGNEAYDGILEDIDAYYKQVSDRNVERNYATQFSRNAKYISLALQVGSVLKLMLLRICRED
jgi:small nuclear ribonucleoprotein (snRNP)-like protein